MGVKIYATHLLMMALILIVPDLRSLASYFWFRRPTPPTTVWAPPVAGRNPRVAILTVEVAVAIMALGYRTYEEAKDQSQQTARMHNMASFTGQWHVESAQLNGKPKPLSTTDRSLITDVYIEPFGAVNLKASDGTLLDGEAHFNQARHSVKLDMHLTDHAIVYFLEQPEASRMVLTPEGEDSRTESTLTLVRRPLPDRYPLLDREPHMVINRMLLR